MSKLLSDISGLTEGLKQTEARDVKFTLSDKDEIETLHIAWDSEPAPNVHKGAYLKAVELGAPDPIAFENNLLGFFYHRSKLPGLDEKPHVNARYVYSLSLENDERMKALFPAVRSAVRRYDANLGGFEDSMLGVETTFENLPIILKSPDISQAKCTYRSALLLSAGPSLNIEWENLRAARQAGQFLIIACDVLMKKALEENVRPDIVVTTERVPGSEDFLTLTKEECEGTLLVSTLMAYPEAIKRWQGRRAFIIRRDYPSHWYPFKNRENIWSAPSVAPTALGILGVLGIKDVALVGQDFCMGEKGESHTNLSDNFQKLQAEMDTAEKKRVQEDHLDVETYGGFRRKTTNAWNVMRGDMTVVKNQWKMNVVSTAFYGAKIVDVPFEYLRKWLAERETDKKTPKHLYLWDENKNEDFEMRGLRNKTSEAIAYLKNLEDHLEDYEPDDLIELPHFRELCLTAVQRPYVTYLNKRFQRRGDKHEYRTLFRAEALSAMREVILILEKYQRGLKETGT